MKNEFEGKGEETHSVVKTRALKFGVRNLLRAFGETPIGRQYPLPRIAHGLGGNVVEIGKGKTITVSETETELAPGKLVIIYKQGVRQ